MLHQEIEISAFEKHLRKIDGLIKMTNEQRRPYIEMMESARKWLIQEMRLVDRVFDKLCTETCTSENYSEWVGVLKADEFELLAVLEFPFPMELGLDSDRPGFVHLDLYGVLEQLKDNEDFEDIYQRLNDLVDWDNAYLKRTSLQIWIGSVIKKTLQSTKHSVYDITYIVHDAVLHLLNVRDKSQPHKQIDIFLVPVVSFGKVPWMHKYADDLIKEDYYYSFYALPVGSKATPTSSNLYTFLPLNLKAENELLWSKDNFRSVFRLIRSLRDRYQLYELKDYFLINTLQWIVFMDKAYIWESGVENCLLHTLIKLWTCFEDRDMPYFWSPDCNLLAILTVQQIKEYTKVLYQICERLTQYPHERQLSYKRTAKHFRVYN